MLLCKSFKLIPPVPIIDDPEDRGSLPVIDAGEAKPPNLRDKAIHRRIIRIVFTGHFTDFIHHLLLSLRTVSLTAATALHRRVLGDR